MATTTQTNGEVDAMLATLHAQLAGLQAENDALKAKPGSALRMKVSEKGGLSVYNLGRFPVTLYQGQWQRLLDASDEIRAFISANQAALSSKS